MSKKSHSNYNPYNEKRNIRVPYTRYSGTTIKRQNRKIRWNMVGAIAFSLSTLILAGVAQEASSLATKSHLYHISIPLTALLSAIFWVILGFLFRRAHKESWLCIYSVFEQSYINDGRPLFRTQWEQDQAELGESMSFWGCLLLGALMIALAIWSLFQ